MTARSSTTGSERIGRLRVPEPAEWPTDVAELANGFAEKLDRTAGQHLGLDRQPRVQPSRTHSQFPAGFGPEGTAR